MPISDQLKTDIFEHNVKSKNVFHIELAYSTNSLPETFFEFFEEYKQQILELLRLDKSPLIDVYGDLEDEESLLGFLYDHKVEGVLIEVEVPKIQDVKLHEDNSYSIIQNWNHTILFVVYGKTLEEALQKAVIFAKQKHTQCVESKKLKQKATQTWLISPCE